MQSKTHPEQSTLPDEGAIQEDAVAQPTARRMPYTTVLAVVVIGIIVISMLWLLVIRQEGNPATDPMVMEPDIQAQADTEVKGSKVMRSEDEYEAIDRRLVSMFGRIDRGFQTQQTDNLDVKRKLAVMAKGLKEIKVAISDLGESNKELGRRVSEDTSKLETITKDIRALKVVKRKPTVKSKPRPVKTPPFHIDAIDVWDDVTYVAVSQAGRVAFLKAGEQQSGWTVTHIDRLKGQVDIQGPAGQAHSVSLQR
ncbi:MAG: hypothetical protein KZQ98_20035 [Candidatus Thiodiazotropha sp. (ex Lucinoma borealis)]|nr:hypothetical protein [Candidatus Thiodiazotropha sp. (ex Lucinoma borealis)]